MLFRKALWLPLLLNLGFISAAHGADALKIGFVAPLSGSFERLGKQMMAGATAAGEKLGQALYIADEVCTPEGGQAAARALIAQKINIVVGFTCFESLNAALPILRDAGITTITTGVRADVLTDNKFKTEFLLYRLAPREDMEVAALTASLLQRWRAQNFAIIDDGTLQARNTAESLRFALTQASLKPVYTDTFRPGLNNQAALVRRLQKAGATHVFVGGDIEDALIISKAAKSEMEIAVGEQANPEISTEGAGQILSVAIPDYRLAVEGADAAIALTNAGIEPDNYALSSYAAVEIAATIETAKLDIANHLSTGNFRTAIGTVSFDEKGDLKVNPFSLVILKNGKFSFASRSTQ